MRHPLARYIAQPLSLRLLLQFIGIAIVSTVAHAADDQILNSFTTSTQAVPDQHSFYGRIQAVNQATVSAETQGRIEEIRVNIGDKVSAGTSLLTITSTEQRAGLTRAEANLTDAQANLLTDQAEYQRVADLVKKGFASKSDMDRVTARLNSSKARVSSAEAALKTAREQLSYTVIKAPYSGIVSNRHVEVGEAVRPGTMLLSGYDPSAFRVEVDIPQGTAEKVRQFEEAQIMTTPSGTSLAIRSIKPSQLILYPTVDPATSTVRVRLELPKDTPDLYPGQFVKVLFTTGKTERLLIPASSVVYRSEVAAVYVLQNGQPRLRQIRPGAMYGEQLEVLAGLEPGEPIATDPVAAAESMNAQKVSASE